MRNHSTMLPKHAGQFTVDKKKLWGAMIAYALKGHDISLKKKSIMNNRESVLLCNRSLSLYPGSQAFDTQ